MAGLDWAGMVRSGFRNGGLRPHEVWALTPAELLLLIGPEQSAAPLGRGGLDELLASFPDGLGGTNE